MKRTSLVMMAAVLALAASPALARHPPVTAADLAQFAFGTSTYEEVVAKLGPPLVVTSNSDGLKVISYGSVKSHVKAATFVPVVGLFAGGSSAETKTVSLTFGPDGRLRSTSAMESRSDCSISIVGGAGCQGR